MRALRAARALPEAQLAERLKTREEPVPAAGACKEPGAADTRVAGAAHTGPEAGKAAAEAHTGPEADIRAAGTRAAAGIRAHTVKEYLHNERFRMPEWA